MGLDEGRSQRGRSGSFGPPVHGCIRSLNAARHLPRTFVVLSSTVHSELLPHHFPSSPSPALPQTTGLHSTCHSRCCSCCGHFSLVVYVDSFPIGPMLGKRVGEGLGTPLRCPGTSVIAGDICFLARCRAQSATHQICALTLQRERHEQW